jgi:hypothetical protein
MVKDHETESPPMTRSEHVLQLLIRLVGTVALLAIPCALMPGSWMNAIHQGLGMGELPSKPVLYYLARSTSAFYGLTGGLLWMVSFDLQRNRPVLQYLGVAIVLVGLLLLGTDLLAGMPWWWSLVEGPFNITFGGVLLLLACRVGGSE